MDPETQKIITEQIKTLPKDVKEAIISVDYKTKLQEITKRQKLLIDQAGKLEMETTLVMIGLEPLTDFIGNIQRELGVLGTRAQEIAVDVSENIFKPIRASLKTMNEPAVETESDVQILAKNIVKEHHGPEEMMTTNTNDVNLNRDQILNEIENPAPNRQIISMDKPLVTPGQPTDLVTAKLSGPVSVSQQIIEAKPEIKLPEIKKKPFGGVDPYREPLA